MQLKKIVNYGENKREFLRKEFEIKNIPSKSTLTRVFIMLSPKWIGYSITGILNTLIKEKKGQIMLDGKSIRSTDAINTTEKIIDKNGDYVLQLKANQGRFYNDVYTMFDDKYMDEADQECVYEIFSTIEKNYGRIEKRTGYVLKDLEDFTDYLNIFRKCSISVHKNTQTAKNKQLEQIRLTVHLIILYYYIKYYKIMLLCNVS